MTKLFKDMTTAELIIVHNSYADPLETIKSWKGKKSVLIERIAAIKPTKTSTIRECAIEALCKVAYFENRDEDPSPENRVNKNHSKARSVGMPYNEIISNVLQVEFPACKTSIACLRWYAVKIRIGDDGYNQYTLPQRRPRVKAKKG